MSPDRSLDLHAHTTASDGDHTPTQLVEHAAAIGLTALAITDHDTTDGIAEAQEAGARLGIEIVPGIELSAEFSRGQCHMLGYLIDPANPELCKRLKEIRTNRTVRNRRIIAQLQDMGIPITLKEVAQVAGGDIVARPHFARVLVNKGVVRSMQEAFDVYLAKGAKAYIERQRLTPEEAIDLVHGAGGLIVIAHPNNMKRSPTETETALTHLKEQGLDGIEARYNLHTPEDNARYLALAERLELLTTGGSDFHGPSVKATVYLGHVEGGLPAPNSLLDNLKSAQNH